MRFKRNPVDSSIPTAQDIQSIRSIYQRLAGESDIETLINLLEWQERNIQYWKERYWVSSVITIILWALLIPLIALFFEFLAIITLRLISHKIPYILALITDRTIFVVEAILLWALILLPSFALFLGYINYNHIARERQINRREKLKKLAKRIWHTIKLNLSLTEILDYRMAVCRDYAKLTAALLLNAYPEVHFITLPNHVAAAVRINGKYYVLDQRLPIMTLDSWIENWKWLLWWERIKNKFLRRTYTPKCDIYVVQIKRNPDGGISDGPTLHKHMTYTVKSQKRKNIEICIKKLEALLARKFDLDQGETDYEEPDLRIPIQLKNYTLYCEDDEIILHSMARGIKNRIEAEICGNITRLSGIKVSKEDARNLVVEIYLK